MANFDLIVKGGTVVTAADTVRCDVGVKDGRIEVLANSPSGADEVIMRDGTVMAEPGRGKFLACDRADIEPPVGAAVAS